MTEHSHIFANRRFSPFCVWFTRSQFKMLTVLSSCVPVLQLFFCRENVKMLNEMSAMQRRIKLAFPAAKRSLDSHSRSSFMRFSYLYFLIISYATLTFIMSMQYTMESFFSYMLSSIPIMMFFYLMAYYFAIAQLIIGCQRFLCSCLEENLSTCSKKGVKVLLKIMFLMSNLFYAKERFVATLKLQICTVTYGIISQIIFHVRRTLSSAHIPD